MYNAKRVISHTQLLSQLNALFAFALLKAQAALFKVSTPFLVCQVTCFKKDGRNLEQVQKLELKGLGLV